MNFFDITESGYDAENQAWVPRFTNQAPPTCMLPLAMRRIPLSLIIWIIDGPLNSSALVKPVLKTLSTLGPRKHLEKFTSFRTRCK